MAKQYVNQQYWMDHDHSLLGGSIVHNERHLLQSFEVRSLDIQVTRPYFCMCLVHPPSDAHVLVREYRQKFNLSNLCSD